VLRFINEARVAGSLRHENIVTVLTLCRDDDGLYQVQEYIDGQSLEKFLSKHLKEHRAGLPEELAIDIIRDVCNGLQHAFERGVIHRDIKPANIFLTASGVPKLGDSGLAYSRAREMRLSVSGAVMGTCDYMPHEQKADSTKADHRSDIYSLGVTLGQLVTGKSPPPTAGLKGVRSKALREVLERALEYEPDDRYQTAAEFSQALHRVRRNLCGSSSVQLEEGECPSSDCRTVNSVDRKFCKTATKLVVRKLLPRSLPKRLDNLPLTSFNP